MNNDSISSSDCQWYHNNSNEAVIFGYYVATPIYFALGGIGHFICLLAFYQQRKKESAYTYQLFVVISETIEIMTYVFYTTTFYWFSGAEGHRGHDWFMSCYSCMYYAGYMSTPVINMFITSSMLFSIAVAVDRILCITKPFVYKNINHKRHQAVTFVCCYAIGIATSLFDINRFKVVEKPITVGVVMYEIIINDAFVNSKFANAAAQLRNAIRIFGVLLLITGNIVLLVAYRSRMKKVGDKNSDKNEARRKDTERTLTLLAILDSLLNAAGMSLLISYYIVMYSIPSFFSCAGALYTPLLDGLLQFADIGDFYLAIAVSKQFRNMIWELPCFSRNPIAIASVGANHNYQVNVAPVSTSAVRAS